LITLAGVVITSILSINKIKKEFKNKIKMSSYKLLYTEKISAYKNLNYFLIKIEDILYQTREARVIPLEEIDFQNMPNKVTKYYEEVGEMINSYRSNYLYFSEQLTRKMDVLVELYLKNEESLSQQEKDPEEFYQDRVTQKKEEFLLSSKNIVKEIMKTLKDDLKAINRKIGL